MTITSKLLIGSVNHDHRAEPRCSGSLWRCAHPAGWPSSLSLCGAVAMTAAAGPASAAGVRLQSVGRFDSPVFATSPPGDAQHLYIVQQGGKIVVLANGRRLSQPFLDLSGSVVSGGEQGLLGLAFAPDYASTRRFYVYYTDRARVRADRRVPRGEPRARRRRQFARAADPARHRVQPQRRHARLRPRRLLYAGLGDGGGGGDQHGPRGNGQNLGTLLGKILRIDPRAVRRRPYTIPASNPFVGRAGARGEIYAYGLRNPWRFSFDRRPATSRSATSARTRSRRSTSRGAAAREARTTAGAAGGTPAQPTNRRPARSSCADQAHGDGYCSITGGYVVRDPALPALRGRYVYGDFCDGRVRAATLRPGQATGDRQLDLPRSDRSRRSARTAPGASTSRRWAGRSTAWRPARPSYAGCGCGVAAAGERSQRDGGDGDDSEDADPGDDVRGACRDSGRNAAAEHEADAGNG